MKLKHTCRRCIYALCLAFIFTVHANAQSSGSFYVDGDVDKFYPVTFQDGNWFNNKPTTLYIGRSDVHLDASWRGSTIAEFNYHLTQWGNGSAFINCYIQHLTQPFVAGWRDGTQGNSDNIMIVWLRGGGTTYYYDAEGALVYPAVYDNVSNSLPFNETSGPSHSYKTDVDANITQNGWNYSGSSVIGGSEVISGNLGVGTTAPGTKLEVVSDGMATFTYPTIGKSYGSMHIAPLAGTADNTTALTFGANGTGGVPAGAHAGIYVQSSGYYGTKMYFGTTDDYGTGSKSRMMIDHLGNVGIGNTAPGFKLDVSGTIRTPRLMGPVNDNLLFSSYDNGSGGGYGMDFQAVENGFSFWTHNSSGWDKRLVVHDNGNIGIGTATPGELLHLSTSTHRLNAVMGDYAVVGQTGGGLATVIGNNVRVNVGNDNRVDYLTTGTNGVSAIEMLYDRGISFFTRDGSVTSGNMFFTPTDRGYERMRIDFQGNVMIGTQCIKAGYKFGVKGKIICEELKVKNEGGVCWADYVFDKNYKLMPLKDVEQFISTNKHLPLIPPASEVESEGITVSEMLTSQMVKIEELTLYIIELQKRIEALEKAK